MCVFNVSLGSEMFFDFPKILLIRVSCASCSPLRVWVHVLHIFVLTPIILVRSDIILIVRFDVLM
jgi:hypothetical protein